jgi:hypothetical protein
MSLSSSFVEFLYVKYPGLPRLDISDRLICESPVVIAEKTLLQIKSEIAAYKKLKFWTAKTKKSEYEKMGLNITNNFSVCDSFDFHTDAAGNIQLIEVNTNASFLALGVNLYEFLQKENLVPFSETDLVNMFRREMKLAGATEPTIFILDEKPQEQRLYIEFLLYKEIFKKHGLGCEIVDAAEVGAIENIPSGSLVYNRHTDFYLSEQKSLSLRNRFNSKELFLSPNPWEYFQLADKIRLLDWNSQSEIEKPNSLLAVYDLDIETPEKIWALRKNLFFKPKSSFGGKGVFKGASISKKVFDSFFGQHFIAQQLAPPAEVDIEVEALVDNKPNREFQKMKFDLRCYAYDEQLQMIIARVYQGQSTNLRTVGGGFAIVKVE